MKCTYCKENVKIIYWLLSPFKLECVFCSNAKYELKEKKKETNTIREDKLYNSKVESRMKKFKKGIYN
jgi:hypothetical protein